MESQVCCSPQQGMSKPLADSVGPPEVLVYGLLLAMASPAALVAPSGYRLISIAASAGVILALSRSYFGRNILFWAGDQNTYWMAPLPGLAVGLLTRAIVGKKDEATS